VAPKAPKPCAGLNALLDEKPLEPNALALPNALGGLAVSPSIFIDEEACWPNTPVEPEPKGDGFFAVSLSPPSDSPPKPGVSSAMASSGVSDCASALMETSAVSDKGGAVTGVVGADGPPKPKPV
jgi:hypothetical protein